MHRVVALALPQVVAFDLSIPAQVFGRLGPDSPYSFDVCTPRPGSVPTTTGFSVEVGRGLEALDDADSVVVPGMSRMTSRRTTSARRYVGPRLGVPG